jgi:DMSO/TMAO reductase YedYZ molybdopterin-dependent catalytic subunit
MDDHTEWSPPHSHDPNPAPPSADATFVLRVGPEAVRLTPDDLWQLPQQRVTDCMILSTGHPPSGPFTFSGVAILALIERYVNINWAAVDVKSGDGFGARLTAVELRRDLERPALLALTIDGQPLTRVEGLVRLIVPSETDDALRQVKWVSEIRVIR